MEKIIPLQIYIHIPFCVRKCLYCDFLSFPKDTGVTEKYVKTLEREIKAMGELFLNREVCSIFFGGGTPSVLEPSCMVRIMEALRESFPISRDAEVTAEANPGTLDQEKLRVYKELGMNRLSLGLQSADNKELRELGRIHTWEEFLNSFRKAREAGFDNINVDLMAAIPGQTLASYERTLRLVTALEPEHISAYSLMVEAGTPFYERYGEPAEECGKFPPLPDEDAERRMYHFTREFLKDQGYERYEISNYGKPGRECRHNVGYWTGTEYLGLGLGASSYVGGERFVCEADMDRYLSCSFKNFKERKHHGERELLTLQAQMEEFMFLGLRLTKGVSSQEFLRRFNSPVMAVYGEALEKHLEKELMEKYQEGEDIIWRLTEFGTDVSNQVLCGFLL